MKLNINELPAENPPGFLYFQLTVRVGHNLDLFRGFRQSGVSLRLFRLSPHKGRMRMKMMRRRRKRRSRRKGG